jgi:acetyl-CoA carboxylase carboxyl transferase subunit beta
MGWFTRVKEGITTSTEEKKETPEGLWYKCPECDEIMTSEDHENNLWVCVKCDHHEKIGSEEYFASVVRRSQVHRDRCRPHSR